MPNFEENSVGADDLRQKRRLAARRRAGAFIRNLFRLIFKLIFLTIIAVAGYYVLQWGIEVYREVQIRYAGYVERQQENIGEVDARFGAYTNVLVLGIDDSVNSDNIPEKRADAVLLASLDNSTGEVRLVNIPRYTWVVETQGHGEMRLEKVYALGGAPLMIRTVNDLLGISIHQYVVIDMQAFTSIIDTLGGIDLYVEQDMDYDDPEAGIAIHMAQGYRHLDGKSAGNYLRYRGGDLGDLGRTQRQQKFVKAFYDKLLSVDTLRILPELVEVIKQKVVTSIEVFDSVQLGNVIRKLSTKPPRTIMLPGAVMRDNDTIWIVDKEQTERMREELFPISINEEEKN